MGKMTLRRYRVKVTPKRGAPGYYHVKGGPFSDVTVSSRSRATEIARARRRLIKKKQRRLRRR